MIRPITYYTDVELNDLPAEHLIMRFVVSSNVKAVFIQ